MAVLPPGTPAPDFTLARADGESFTKEELTGHGSIDSAIESIRDGAFDYVTKPCPLDEIQIRVQRAIERRALKQPSSEATGLGSDRARQRPANWPMPARESPFAPRSSPTWSSTRRR